MSKIVEWYKSESFEKTEKLKHKLNLLKSPIDILNKQEIDEINSLFDYIRESFQKLTDTFESPDSAVILTDNKASQLAREEFKECKEAYLKTKKEVDLYNDKYNNKTKNDINSILGSHSTGYGSESGDKHSEGFVDQGFPTITRIFLNTIITTQDIEEIKRKKSLIDERKFLSKIFFLSLDDSKDQILVDFYMSIFEFSIKQRYSLEKTSTFFSIMYFIFNYSILSKKIIKQKSYLLFMNLIEYHTLHRPPHSYQVFDDKEKTILVDYIKNSFFRNYSLFENIFKYNVNIYLITKQQKRIPKEVFPELISLKQEYMVDNIKESEFFQFIYDSYIAQNTNKVTEDIYSKKPKSEIDEYSDQQMNKLNTLMSSFYAVNMTGKDNENNLEFKEITSKEKLKEINDTKTIIGNKIKEIKDSTNERISIGDRIIEKNLIGKLPEPKDTKKK